MRWLYSSLALIFANLIPILGVTLFGWNVFSVLVLYWFESLIFAVFTILKIERTEKKGKEKVILAGKRIQKLKKSKIIAEFIKTYGIFMLVHLSFIIVYTWVFSSRLLAVSGLLAAFLLLIVSHGISYNLNFVGNKEYDKRSSGELVLASYKRAFIMQSIVVLGAFAIVNTYNKTAILGLIAIKTLFDLLFHLSEHQGWMKKK